MACSAPPRFRVFCPSGHTQPLSGPPRPRGTHTHLSTTRSTGRQGEGAQGTRGDTANPVGPDQEHQDQRTGVQEERRQVGGWHWVWGGVVTSGGYQRAIRKSMRVSYPYRRIAVRPPPIGPKIASEMSHFLNTLRNAMRNAMRILWLILASTNCPI